MRGLYSQYGEPDCQNMKLRQSTRHEVGIGSHPGPRTVAVTSNPDTCGTHVNQVETIVVSGIGYARAENCTGQRMNGGSRNMPSSFSRLLYWKLHRPPIEYPSAGSMLFTDGWMLLRLVSTSPRSRNSPKISAEIILASLVLQTPFGSFPVPLIICALVLTLSLGCSSAPKDVLRLRVPITAISRCFRMSA